MQLHFVEFCLFLIFVVIMIKGCFYLQIKYTQLLVRVGGKPLLFIPASFSVPVHELSHALMAVICFHKVNKVVLFQMNREGTLGYVEHSYSPSVLRIFTNMFIGIAPLIGGALVCTWLFTHFYDDSLSVAFQSAQDSAKNGLDINYFEIVISMIRQNSDDAKFWLVSFIAVNVWVFSLPSPADFQGAGKGIVLTLGMLLAFAYFDSSGSLIEFSMTYVSSVFISIIFLSIIILSPIIVALMIIAQLKGRVLAPK